MRGSSLSNGDRTPIEGDLLASFDMVAQFRDSAVYGQATFSDPCLYFASRSVARSSQYFLDTVSQPMWAIQKPRVRPCRAIPRPGVLLLRRQARRPGRTLQSRPVPQLPEGSAAL